MIACAAPVHATPRLIWRCDGASRGGSGGGSADTNGAKVARRAGVRAVGYPPGMSTKRPATYADIEALPENMVGEIIDDELFVSPRPRPRHAIASSVILTQLNGPFQQGRRGPGGWWIVSEPELHLGKQV